MLTCNRLDLQILGYAQKFPRSLNSGPLRTPDWGPVTIALQALSLVENVEPVQVHFTLRLRDQRSKWMQIVQVTMKHDPFDAM